jgi:enolase
MPVLPLPSAVFTEPLLSNAPISTLSNMFLYTLLQVVISMDVAASEAKKYNLDFKNESAAPESTLSGEELGDMYSQLATDFPIESIEDPFDQVYISNSTSHSTGVL